MSEEKSLLNAIYDRYSEINDTEFQDFISFSPSSSTSTSSSCSPVSSDSNNNLITNKFQQKDISFYIPSAYSPRKTQRLNIKTSISLVLNNLGITHIGDSNELENICKNVLELDLSRNELNDWLEIEKLLSSLKKLRLLNLSLNKFSYYKLENKENEYLDNFTKRTQWPLIGHNFEQLNTLILNSCFLDLKLVESLLERLPCLTELHLASNNYSKINFNKKFIKQTLKILYLNNNLLTNWLEVCKLGKSFPNLENLVLSENNLENFSILFNSNNNNINNNNNNNTKINHQQLQQSQNDDYFNDHNDLDMFTNTDLFKNLKILILNKLKIKDWRSLDQLREFPQLKHVRIQNIPLLEQLNEEEKYYVLVGHLDDSVESLNGSKITSDDKENCERKYIRYFMDSSFKPNRYYELESKHGKLDPLADVNLDLCRRVQVKIKFNDKHIYERIDVRQTVGEFKKYLEKFVGYPSNRFKVFYIDIEACSMAVYGPEELKHTNRCLYSFNIHDNDEFEIDLKPAPVLHTSSSEYQFQYQHLHHLHHHHYNSHMNNNSHFQIPSCVNSNNNLNQTNRIKSRKMQAQCSFSLNMNSNNNNGTLKRSKPGLITSPKMINKTKDLTNLNKDIMVCHQEENSFCTASLPANLNKFNKNECSSCELIKSNDNNENENILENKDVYFTTSGENE